MIWLDADDPNLVGAADYQMPCLRGTSNSTSISIPLSKTTRSTSFKVLNCLTMLSIPKIAIFCNIVLMSPQQFFVLGNKERVIKCLKILSSAYISRYIFLCKGLLIKYAVFSKKYRLTGNQGVMKLAQYASLLCKFYLLQDCNFLWYVNFMLVDFLIC